MGVTGARASVGAGAHGLVDRVRAQTELPVVVGLGVSNGDQAAQVAGFADGVAVGSATGHRPRGGRSRGRGPAHDRARRRASGEGAPPRLLAGARLPAQPDRGVWKRRARSRSRAYALCILLGVVVASGPRRDRRWRARGGHARSPSRRRDHRRPVGHRRRTALPRVTSPAAYIEDPAVRALTLARVGLDPLRDRRPRSSAGTWSAAAAASHPAPSPKPSPWAWPSPRPSAGFGNCSTRAFRAGRRRCPGACEIEPRQPRRRGRRRGLPPDVPLRAAVEPRRRGAARLGRPPLEARGRPGLRAVRRRLRGGPALDRGAAHRRRGVPARPAAQPVRHGRAAGRRRGVPRRAPQARARAAGRGAARGRRRCRGAPGSQGGGS
jgi:hypothetical protein